MSLYHLEQVRHLYQQRPVLHIPDLQIEAGEILALVGPSGAGKSTLLRLLALLEAPTQGKVTLHLENRSINYSTATMQERRRIAMVFQRPLLLSGSVTGNLRYGLRLRGNYDGKTQIYDMLEKLSLQHLAKAKASTLSGGEMQRVALARTLILQPDILLLDEPTANLDPYNVRVIEGSILSEHQRYQPTVVIVTHNIFQARRLATRIAFILDGEPVEIGTPEQFFESPRDERTRAFLSGELIC